MCKHPIQIINRTKYLTGDNGQPYYIYINCGECSECKMQKQTEWTLRTYYETLDTIKDGKGYVYFDTLTYDNNNIPRLSNYIEHCPNWQCFDYRDIRYFYETLRQKTSDKIRYFITSEYGDIRHRPHYHILLFIKDEINIEPLELSKKVSESWKFGRTDGIPYKSKKYVLEHNTMNKINLDAIRYISKYVVKEQSFKEVINKRWQQLEKFYNISKFNKLEIKKIRMTYYRLTSPFHRQSQHYGATALQYTSLDILYKENKLFYKDDTLKINKYCSLPLYFKRILFQEQIEYNGKKLWIWNDKGIEYKKFRENIITHKLTNRLKDANVDKGTNYTDEELTQLAHYILFERGRFKGTEDYKAHHKDAKYFNYNTDKDIKYIGNRIISTQYAGNDVQGYITTNIEQLNEDIVTKVYINKIYERMINKILNYDENYKELVKLKEHLNEIRKIYFNVI